VKNAARPAVKAGGDRDLSKTPAEVIERRVTQLAEYQDQAYAERYLGLVERVRNVEAERAPGRTGLTEAVARALYKLMAYKDEYEVARLYTDGRFAAQLGELFEGDYRLEFHLAPPLLTDKDAKGHLKKRRYGPFMLQAFRLLARFKFLRGGFFDVFGRTEERRTERRLIGEYVAVIEEIIQRLSHENYATAVELAKVPERIRGYGHIKEAAIVTAKKAEAQLLAALRAPAPTAVAAE
jgi:indolepyruvate ferredoxin oxidoreductase